MCGNFNGIIKLYNKKLQFSWKSNGLQIFCKMAASGITTIEWSTNVKPILTSVFGQFFDKNDALEIIQAIIKSENEFQNHDDAHDLFYTCFACLSAHFISINTNTNNIPADQLSTAQDAFRIILQQILKKLSEAGSSQDDTSNTGANVSVKQLLLPIVGLCGIEGGGYPPSDLVILTSLLKIAKLPTHLNSENQSMKTSVISSPITSLASQTSTSEKQQPTTAQKRSDALLEQLTMPLRSQVISVASTPIAPAVAMSPGSKDSLESGKEGSAAQQTIDMKKWVASTCASLLVELRAGSVVLKVCQTLPCLQRYINRWQAAKESNMAPQFISDASLLHFLVNEVHVCQLAVSLPCLEPFTPERITILSDMSTAWLFEQQTATLVESALNLYNTVGDTFKQSTRAGGYVYQNHLMIGAWVLICGLHHALGGAPGSAASAKGPAKAAFRPYNLTKMLMLVALGVVCYRKATNLKRAVVQKQNQDADPERSDSTSTLVAPDADSGLTRPGASDASDANDNVRTAQGIVPDKAEPYSLKGSFCVQYISLATEVFSLLTTELLSGGAERLGAGALLLHEAHLAVLAALARDLDRETARTDTGTISPCFGPRLGALYSAFSSALVRYLHNLSSSPAFVSQQPALQHQLVGPRVLKLVGGMVLSKAAADRENTILMMWHKLINTLQECALTSQPSPDHDYEDLNVEHAQMMVYLFRSLTLMLKKSVLLMTSNAIIKIVETLSISDRKRAMNLAPHQLMLTTRLMLILEYLMKHLYDAPQTLLQQIEWNLVIAPGLAQPSSDSSCNEVHVTDNGQIKSRIYCEVPFIEQAYRKLSQDDTSMRPKFYALTTAKINNQENPKFDGLACNFVLGTPHKLKYPLLVDALLALLHAAGVCDAAATARAIVYQLLGCRLVISMPPATPHMDKLQLGITAILPAPLPLYAIVWVPRADSKKLFYPWFKDALVKQGMYTQYAETLLDDVTLSCDNIKYSAWLASQTIQHLKENMLPSGLPSLLDVISCDSALTRLKVCLMDASSSTDAHPFLSHLLELLEIILDCCRTPRIPCNTNMLHTHYEFLRSICKNDTDKCSEFRIWNV
ncbi:unnamed protein product [Leptidea sinapis]|uniref:E3 ubiquitin-protein ligase UBR4 N-terminal domain-containing protein n=1 Tax=Leptidea sinapis TaxID=189913 RepID=A0A5E4R6W5_9NEOP|nr:unnamed protein product [Leptidea sinapis]